MNTTPKQEIVYEAEDKYSTDAFKKYGMVSNNYSDQSKAGVTIKNYIETAEEYIKNFKGSRDSEFSEYDELDLTKLREARHAEIKAIRDKDNIDIYKVKRGRKGDSSMNPNSDAQGDENNRGASRGGRGPGVNGVGVGPFYENKLDDISDLIAQQTDDEEKLLNHFMNQHSKKAANAERDRHKHSKLMDLNEQMRKFDFNTIRQEELDHVNEDMLKLNLQWRDLQSSLEEKLRFCEKMHKKHHQEVGQYSEYTDEMDKDKLNLKIKRAVFELKSDSKDLSLAPWQLQQDLERHKVYIDREKHNLEEANAEYEKLKNRLNSVDGTLNKSNERLRKEIEKMKQQMEKITLYNIDIARDPSKAIKLICDPILDLISLKVEDFEEQLKENMAQKQNVTEQIVNIKNQIFEQKTKQINLERDKEEIKVRLPQIREDIDIILDQMQENIIRKTKLARQVESITMKFQEEAQQVQDELNQAQKKLIKIFKHKDKVQDQAEYLFHDRGEVGRKKKYHLSIGKFIELAKNLKVQYDGIHEKLKSIGEDLNLDTLYTEPHIVDVYRVGKFAEKEKKDLLLRDLELKQEHIIMLLSEKEEVEEQLASFGSIHYIYKTYKDIQDELKREIKKYIRDKHQTNIYLEGLLNDLEINSDKIGRQEGNLRTHKAKYRAIQYLLQEKLLKAKILEEELLQAKKIRLGVQPVEQEKDGLNFYEKEIVLQMDFDMKQKSLESGSLIQIIKKKDQTLEELELHGEEETQLSLRENFLMEEKARILIQKTGFEGEFKKLGTGLFRLGDKMLVYLRMLKGGLETQIICKPSMKLDILKKKLPQIPGQEADYFFDFEKVLITLNGDV